MFFIFASAKWGEVFRLDTGKRRWFDRLSNGGADCKCAISPLVLLTNWRPYGIMPSRPSPCSRKKTRCGDMTVDWLTRPTPKERKEALEFLERFAEIGLDGVNSESLAHCDFLFGSMGDKRIISVQIRYRGFESVLSLTSTDWPTTATATLQVCDQILRFVSAFIKVADGLTP